MLLSLAIAASLVLTQNRPATVPARLDVDIMLRYLRGNGDADQLQATQLFPVQSDAPDAIPRPRALR